MLNITRSLEIGKKYHLDKGYRVNDIVEVVEIYGYIYAKVKSATGSGNGEWVVMQNRLSEV